MSDNYLKPIKENIFTKIVSFVKRFFSKEKEDIIEVNEEIIDNHVENQRVEKEKPDSKARYIELYSKTRKKEISVYSLSFEELFVLNQMADSEIDVLTHKIASVQSDS